MRSRWVYAEDDLLDEPEPGMVQCVLLTDVQAWMEKNAQAYQREGKYERAAAVFALLHVLADLAREE